MTRSHLIGLVLLSALGACTDTAPVHEEPLPGEEELWIGKADGASGARWTYYAITRVDADGLWVKRFNQPDTKCADGKWKTECLVASIDWSRAGFSADDTTSANNAASKARAILRGKLLQQTIDGHKVSVFQATESWERSS